MKKSFPSRVEGSIVSGSLTHFFRKSIIQSKNNSFFPFSEGFSRDFPERFEISFHFSEGF